MATGHYARKTIGENSLGADDTDSYELLRGRDSDKDQ
ncbi:MAG: hypothetical protein ACPHGZ_08315 [Schleiferiaceae bacterium]